MYAMTWWAGASVIPRIHSHPLYKINTLYKRKKVRKKENYIICLHPKQSVWNRKQWWWKSPNNVISFFFMATLVLYSPVEGRVWRHDNTQHGGRQVEALASCSTSLLCQEHGSRTLSQFLLSGSRNAEWNSTLQSHYHITTLYETSHLAHFFQLDH